MFVDQYDEEFSRDIEPMRGGHGDNYYWQLVANVRRYKGAPELPAASSPQTIKVKGGFEQWRGVLPEFTTHSGETLPRDFDGTGGMHYENHTGRNEFAALKVARDRDNIYFYARTVAAITPAGTNWMWLLIDADQKVATGWSGYDFMVNREPASDGKFWLEKNTGGWNWEKVAPVKIRVAGNELQLAIPRRALGLKEGETKTAIDFQMGGQLAAPG